MISYDYDLLFKQLRCDKKASLLINLLIFHRPLQLGACSARIAQAHAAQLSFA